MSGKKGQKKRFWSDEEKRSICGQTSAPDVSVALVARRYSMNANLIHKWRRAAETMHSSEKSDFVKVALPRPVVSTSPQVLKLELTCAHGPVVIHWPMDQLNALADWLRES